MPNHRPWPNIHVSVQYKPGNPYSENIMPEHIDHILWSRSPRKLGPVNNTSTPLYSLQANLPGWLTLVLTYVSTLATFWIGISGYRHLRFGPLNMYYVKLLSYGLQWYGGIGWNGNIVC